MVQPSPVFRVSLVCQRNLTSGLQPCLSWIHSTSSISTEDGCNMPRSRGSELDTNGNMSNPQAIFCARSVLGWPRDMHLPLSCTAARHYGSPTMAKKWGPGMRFELPRNPFSSARKKLPVPRLVLYKGPGMMLFRLIVRAKVFQLLGALTVAVMVSVAMTAQELRPWDLAAAGGLALGCVVTSYCVWYYSSRYVGELSLLLPERHIARFSVLDFYGNRQDDDVPVEQIVAPFKNRSVAQVKALTSRLLMPVDVRQGEHQYYISVAHGRILEKQILLRLFYGKHLDDLAAERQATSLRDAQPPLQFLGNMPSSSTGSSIDCTASAPVMGSAGAGSSGGGMSVTSSPLEGGVGTRSSVCAEDRTSASDATQVQLQQSCMHSMQPTPNNLPTAAEVAEYMSGNVYGRPEYEDAPHAKVGSLGKKKSNGDGLTDREAVSKGQV